MKKEKLFLFAVLLSGISVPQAEAGWWDSFKNYWMRSFDDE